MERHVGSMMSCPNVKLNHLLKHEALNSRYAKERKGEKRHHFTAQEERARLALGFPPVCRATGVSAHHLLPGCLGA